MWRNMVETIGGKPILGTPFVGLLAEQILAETSTGTHGPGLMANDNLVAGKRYRLVLQSAFGSDGLVKENGEFTVTAPASTSYLLYEDNLLVSSTPTEVTVGSGSPGAITLTCSGLAQVVCSAVAGVGVTMIGGDGVWLSKRKVKVISAGEYAAFQMLDYQEIDNVSFDFSGELLLGEIIVAASTSLQLTLGAGGTAGVLVGDPRIQGSEVVQRVQGVTPNTAYTMRILADLNTGRRVVGSVLLSFSIK